jgi:predicted SnoaL-like aldol condensation-catalyzing enzyme
MIEMKKGHTTSKLSKKERAVSFLQQVASGNVQEAFETHASPDFYHHNPYFRGDAASLMEAMEKNAAENPDKIFEVKHAIEEGDIIAVHSHVKQHPGDLGAVVVHIFRFQEEQIVEAWDIGQLIPEESPNENGFF